MSEETVKELTKRVQEIEALLQTVNQKVDSIKYSIETFRQHWETASFLKKYERKYGVRLHE